MPLHEDAAALLADVCAREGELTYIRRLTLEPPADPGQDWKPGDPSTTDEATCALWTEYSTREIDGELVLRGDHRVTTPALSGLDPVPNLDLIVRFPGDTDQIWTVQAVRAVRRGATTSLIEIQARQATA